MTFPLNVYLLTAASACLTTVIALPVWRKWCLRAGLVDDPGKRKIHDRPTPLAGGLAVLTGILLPTLAACVLAWLQDSGTSLGHRAISLPGHFLRLFNYDPALLDADSGFLLKHGL